MKPTSVLILLLICSPSLYAEPRTWTSKDGRQIKAEFVSATQDSVTVRREDGITVPIPLAILSAEDTAWINNQPKPVEITQDQIDKIVRAFPRAAALAGGEVTNELKQLHDKYESMVKFIRPGTIGPNLKMIRKKIDDDVKVLEKIAQTSQGDGTGKRLSGQSQAAENGILSARRNLKWLQGPLSVYLQSFDALSGTP